MIHCTVYALLVSSVITSVAFAADWRVATATFVRTDLVMAVGWTGLHFGVSADYAWARGSANTFFTGDFAGDDTPPFGLGPTELSGTGLSSSGNNARLGLQASQGSQTALSGFR